MKFTDTLWKGIGDIYPEIIRLPFIQELMNGTLHQDRFLFYVQQDCLYLKDYSKVLAMIAAKSDKTGQIIQFLQFAEYSLVVEEERHRKYLAEHSVKPGTQKSPSCLNYTNLLLSVAALGGIEEAMAAVLPCFCVYEKIAGYIYSNAHEDNPYYGWINAYSGEEFRQATDTALEITDELADQASSNTQAKMKEYFVLSTKMEYMFWDSAYRKEKWVI